jgi:hypothetical protein
MAARCFVLNEWVLHDLSGDSGGISQGIAIRLFEAMIARRDQFAALRGSPWWDKAYKLMKREDPAGRTASRFLHLSVLLNANVCRLLEASKVLEAPEDLAKVTPIDDLYLVRTYLTGGANLLVTSDTGLFQALKDTASVTVVMKEEFLKEYLG